MLIQFLHLRLTFRKNVFDQQVVDMKMLPDLFYNGAIVQSVQVYPIDMVCFDALEQGLALHIVVTIIGLERILDKLQDNMALRLFGYLNFFFWMGSHAIGNSKPEAISFNSDLNS